MFNTGIKLLYLLVLSVVLDGLLRRLVGGEWASYLIFLKDAMVVLLGLMTLGAVSELPTVGKVTLQMCLVATLILFPCIIRTAMIDPMLAVFGGKQYILFVWVAPATFLILSRQPLATTYQLFRFLGVVIVLTSTLAFIQLKLPADHILNLSVSGDTMGEFSAGGFLRVSASFPFVAQYAMFLNFAISGMLFGIANPSNRKEWRYYLLKPWVLIPAYLVGIFATASRAAVIGAGAILVIVVGLLFIRQQGRLAMRLLLSGLFAIGVIVLIRKGLPDVTSGYMARSSGESGISHTTELIERVKDMFIASKGEQEVTLLGNGLGLMSNGSQRLSQVAAAVRADGTWTETDLATTYYEGGVYLLLVWMSFRIWVLVVTFKLVLRIRDTVLYLVATGLFGYIAITAVLGTLGIQPPLAIWFWLAVGLVFVLAHHDNLGSPAPLPGRSGLHLRPLPPALRWMADHRKPTRRI